MRSFVYFQPTEIRFGAGRLDELGEVVARYGRRCLLVTMPMGEYMQPLIGRVQATLAAAGVTMAHFDGVVPNPTTDCVSAGAAMARQLGADVVVGIGGGSAMDTAKAIAVEATHPGTCWDYFSSRHRLHLPRCRSSPCRPPPAPVRRLRRWRSLPRRPPRQNLPSTTRCSTRALPSSTPS